MGGKLFFALMYRDKSIYQEEFGNNLKKILIVFDRIIGKKDLTEIKIITSQIENEFCDENRRAINIDPGYFNDKEVVLASFKGKDFKEKLGDGVFAHKMLEFKDGNIKEFPHTFPDFKSGIVKDFFIELIK